MKFKIVYVNEKIGNGFIGMNSIAAKELGIPFNYPRNTILIYKPMPKNKKKRTIRHEKIEFSLMRKGMKYVEAHSISNRLEKFKRIKIVRP